MAESNLFINPVDIALPHAERLVTKGLLDDQEVGDEVKRTLVETERLAAEQHLLDERYQVMSRRSVLVPVSGDGRVVQFNDLRFEGELKTYGIVLLGKIGGQAMRALCLAFDNVRPLPGNESLTDKSTLFYVPAFAIPRIDSLKVA